MAGSQAIESGYAARHMRGPRLWGAVVALNAVLALGIQAAAPPQPARSDRQEYEYAGKHGLEPNCGWSVYCYRVLVPVVLEQIPIDADLRWRGYQVTANTVAGSIVAVTTAAWANGLPAAAIATILVQTSFGFAFTAYDPYTADPFVFVIAAAIAWCWLTNRAFAALAVGLAGVFAKETVALVSAATALAALLNRQRSGWRLWMAQAALVMLTLLAFHWIMDTYFGWGITKNAAARFSEGSWLALWWANNPSLLRKLFFLFVPFGFAWLYAAAGYRTAPRDLRHLATGALLPFLALNYVQNPERALANSFFVIIPLAAIALTRVPFGVALAAAVTNGLFTAKVGTSTAWLPSSAYLLVPAAASAAWVLWHLRRNSGVNDREPE